MKFFETSKFYSFQKSMSAHRLSYPARRSKPSLSAQIAPFIFKNARRLRVYFRCELVFVREPKINKRIVLQVLFLLLERALLPLSE